MPRFLPHALPAWVVLAVLPACSESGYTIDPYPVSVDFDNGVPQMSGCLPEISSCDSPLTVVLDSATPVTVVRVGSSTERVRRRTSIELRSPAPSGVGTVARARFAPTAAVTGRIGPIGVDVCTADGSDPSQSLAPLQPKIVVGGDVLSRVAVRLDPANKRLFFFPYIAGDGESLARECSGNFPLGLSGGGTFLLDDAEVFFPASRLVVGACLNLDRAPTRQQPRRERRPRRRGADANLVVATGLPFTVLSESAYRRAHQALTGVDVDVNLLPAVQLSLPGVSPGCEHAVAAHLGELEWLGLSADELDGRGACDEITISRFLDLGGCTTAETIPPDPDSQPVCPCNSDEDEDEDDRIRSCRSAGASTEAGPIEVVIVPDDSEFLQSLRTELRPEAPDVDGLLGMNALMTVVTDLDYNNARMVLRCDPGSEGRCAVRPELDFDRRGRLLACLGQQAFISTEDFLAAGFSDGGLDVPDGGIE